MKGPTIMTTYDLRPVSRPTVDTPTALLPYGYERAEGDRKSLLRELRRARQAGEITIADGPYADGPGRAVALVQRHRAPRSPWPRRLAISGAIGAPIAGVLYFVKLAMDTVGAALREVTAPAALGLAFMGLVILCAAGLARRADGRVVEGTFRARIK